MKQLIYSLIFTLLTSVAFSQGWQQQYPYDCDTNLCLNYIIDIEQTADGGYIALESYQNTFKQGLLKVDQDGIQQWRKLLPSDSVGYFKIETTSDLGYVLFGVEESYDTINQKTDLKTFILKLDLFGNEVWRTVLGEFFYDFPYTMNYLGVNSLGNYIVSHYDTTSTAIISLIHTIDTQGNILWTKTYEQLSNLTLTPDDEIITFAKIGNTNPISTLVTKLDINGDTIWTNLQNTDYIVGNTPLKITHNNEILSWGWYVLAKFDSLGNLLWKKNYFSNFIINPEGVAGIVDSKDSNYVLILNTEYYDTTGIIQNSISLCKIDTAGNILFLRDLKAINSNAISGRTSSVVETDDNSYILGGMIAEDYVAGYPEANSIIWKVDENGYIYTSIVEGKVSFDTNSNCSLDSTELLLNNWVVEIQDSSQSYYTLTDSNGYYQFYVDSSNYIINIHPPSISWTACLNNQPVNINYFDTVAVDFSMQAAALCPNLEVDISTPRLRQCCVNTYTINYCNTGTQAAPNSQLYVYIDDDLIVINDTVNGNNVLIKNIGTVGVNECGQFIVDVVFDTTALPTIGLTHCVTAKISPDTICSPNTSNWNGAKIEVTGSCTTDSIYFLIKNIGGGDMSQQRTYFVIEDDVIMLQNPFQLNQNDSIWVILPTTNKSYTLLAQQDQNYPYGEHSSAFVEGCGNFTTYSTGFVNLFPIGGQVPSITTDCSQSVGSFDPNDKQATPIGWDIAHNILQNTSIEYKIRFQNTGTDTAFNIVVRDTIDTELLDITTLQMGSSSHSYKANIINNGILKLTFANIMLPDSNVNEAASHGYFTFTIQQMKDNPLGSWIENKAAIYFDYNAPIITNTVFHTVGVLPIMVKTNSIVSSEMVELKVYPNPLESKARFELEDKQLRNLSFKVYDVTGRVVHEANYEQAYQFDLYKNNLSSGIYFYTLQSNGKNINQGKIIVR